MIASEQASKPRLRDYHVVGNLPQGVRGLVRARRLLGDTQRMVAKGRAGDAGRKCVAVSADALAGVEVDCERVGLRWRLSPADLAQRLMFSFGSFERALVEWMLGELRAGDTVADVGAHVGLLSMQFARRLEELGEGRVVSFEPSPDSAQRLRQHAEANGLTQRVTVVEAAVGAVPGVVTLRGPEGARDQASLRSLHGSGPAVATDVPLIRFDDWWDDAGHPRIDVVKIDVEGGELDVVNGMRRTLSEARPRLLVVEIKDTLAAQAGSDSPHVDALLADVGYRKVGPFSVASGVPHGKSLDDNYVYRPDV